MEINVSKNSYKTLRNIAEADNEVTYEWDIIVPDSKPDIKKIIVAEGVCSLNGKEIMQDRAVINGSVALNIMYEPADMSGTVRSIESNRSFNYIMELAGLERDACLYCSCRVKRIKATVINSRKVNVIAALELCGAALIGEEISYVDGISGGETEFLRKEIYVSREVHGGEGIADINESFEIPVGKPSAGEILKTSLQLKERDIRPMNGKVLCKGEIGATVIYNGENEGDGTAFFEFSIPFTEMFDAEEITDSCIYDGDLSVENIESEIITDGENERRTVNISAQLKLTGRGYERLMLDAVVDAYGRELEAELEKISLPEGNAGSGESRITVKDIVAFPADEGINKVMNIKGRDYVKSVCADNGKVLVEGAVVADILYNSSESSLPVSFITKELPFSGTVEIKEAEKGSVCRVKTEIVSIGYSIINSTQLEIRILLDISVHIKKKKGETVLNNVSLSGKAVSLEKSGITVCFCDGKEEMWDIAKKYKTTVTDIMDANELSDGEIKPGFRLLIP